MSKVNICSTLLLVILVGPVAADQAELEAVKDSGFIATVVDGEVIPSANNFGGHSHVPVGTANNQRLNRGVFEFDLSSIPADATITSASFEFEVTLQGGPDGQAGVDFGLFRITNAWDEGTGTSNVGEPTADGVTWSMRTANDAWDVLGGDFSATAVGTTFVDGPSDYSIGGSGLASVIQNMVDGVIPNNGFLLKGEPEGVLGSAARVSTREGGSAAKLVVSYTDPNFLLGDVNGDGVVNLLDVAPFVDILVGGGFACEADLNQDGLIDLLDVAPFIDLLSG